MFFNPFRNVWVFSHRIHTKDQGGDFERARAYWETKDFFSAGGDAFAERPPVFWSSADARDGAAARPSAPVATQPQIELGNTTRPQVYKIDATPYESVMLGLFEMLSGPTNDECAKEGKPKHTDLQVAFSRDGFYWDRHRETFIGGSDEPGSWERGYISSCGGGCLVVGDELWFYYGAFQGDPKNVASYYVWGGLYANGATGLAKLRRDGFASLRGSGEVVTRPVRFSGGHLFVNVSGGLRAEVLDGKGEPIAPFTKENCRPLRVDSTRTEVTWKGPADLSALAGQPVSFRFYLESADLYAFWVSKDAGGSSGGYVAAGGSGFSGPTDSSAH
jgi:hypothetical protein